ncbi:MAG: relaxase/mobilization nuclease domain-containing protein, partial [Flavobacterium sp.]
MLAKANATGKGFGGKIDYLYDGKLEDRGAVEKGTKVITHSDNIRVPNGADDKLTRNLMKADFIEQAKQHKDYGKDKNSAFVGEHILSFTADDRKKLDPEKLKGITEKYIKIAGINDTQYLAVTHHDTENLHVHILFNRAMNDGTKYKAWKEQNKTLERGVALALE